MGTCCRYNYHNLRSRMYRQIFSSAFTVIRFGAIEFQEIEVLWCCIPSGMRLTKSELINIHIRDRRQWCAPCEVWWWCRMTGWCRMTALPRASTSSQPQFLAFFTSIHVSIIASMSLALGKQAFDLVKS